MQTNAKTARPGAERKRPDRKPKKQAPARKTGPQTAQQTIPYREIFKDGICRVNDRLYTKSMEYEDINYQLAQADDQSAIFDGYCAFLNSFDSSLSLQLSFINHRSRPESKYKLNIPMKEDGYSDMRSEYVEMLESQICRFARSWRAVQLSAVLRRQCGGAGACQRAGAGKGKAYFYAAHL